MRTDLFDFELPPDRIALRPAQPRDSAKLLVVRPGQKLEDRIVRDLPDLLQAGDQLVVNDTKVIAAQLSGRRLGGTQEARVDVTLIKRLDGSRWQAHVKESRKLTVEDKGDAGEVTFAFTFHGPVLDQAIEDLGVPPLPPYIAGKRPTDERDASDYQTMFAQNEGAVAAPTAGLHFTDGLLAALKARGVGLHRVTLHVGAGTFLPVKVDDTSEHKMHAEWGQVSAETAAALNEARRQGGRIVAVGSTSLRLLESAAAENGTIRAFADETAIFMTPGYRFRAVDVAMTNFHLPRSTLMMLVSAFSGRETMMAAYAHALANGYRFYSYGDACLLFPEAA